MANLHYDTGSTKTAPARAPAGEKAPSPHSKCHEAGRVPSTPFRFVQETGPQRLRYLSGRRPISRQASALKRPDGHELAPANTVSDRPEKSNKRPESNQGPKIKHRPATTRLKRYSGLGTTLSQRTPRGGSNDQASPSDIGRLAQRN